MNDKLKKKSEKQSKQEEMKYKLYILNNMRKYVNNVSVRLRIGQINLIYQQNIIKGGIKYEL